MHINDAKPFAPPAALRPAASARDVWWRELPWDSVALNQGRQMRFVVIFEEDSEMVPVREAHEPAHLKFLEDNRVEIPMAGGLRNEHGGPYVGGLWVFDVQSRQRAEQLIESDPYFKAHPREYRLLAWGKALPKYQVLM